jgi:hypothetical protein
MRRDYVQLLFVAISSKVNAGNLRNWNYNVGERKDFAPVSWRKKDNFRQLFRKFSQSYLEATPPEAVTHPGASNV